MKTAVIEPTPAPKEIKARSTKSKFRGAINSLAMNHLPLKTPTTDSPLKPESQK